MRVSEPLEWMLQAYGYEPPYGWWQLTPGPLEEEPVLLTIVSFLQPMLLFFLKITCSSL